MSQGFTAEEREAMKARAEELKAERGGKSKAKALQDCLDKIAELDGTDREIAERIHVLVSEHAPELAARTWYGMPAYAKDGKVVCFLQAASKFNTRYATFGFQEDAQLDDGAMWATSFAVVAMNDEVQARIVDLIKRAVG